ncbi:RsmF rRNA methyltransferase first C-terminal domain-containing protein [Thermoactinomyces intermedius]|uniref:RsmB/NOP family class I SAM-dependent RNA methyltransferase n=1 Tax=Thermoactinomyces intermedius TaxID=2024 RepID=A0A8I1DEA2_THEIN|nr:RsmB/NOP family class I SAM-dependent RNA methyltransferase [Thermoactinomyces intermedius]MBA4548854.1 RsmF rRNA methyltransferase first C-terminal domain-containing protein [Thermoactinomyces intermedius]MBA4835879.1 RsmF rRNA methyltransferase first C-terminal domain-containing protein [Thermoactinomyces intermedius]MBH8594732.1 RsmB/NOP family class I SAM-dependent RNA methyltransferase [Thermoactinomyces intermedius]
MQSLPQDFLELMKSLLGDEYPAFLKTYESAPVRSLRVNTLKTGHLSFPEKVPFRLEPVPWCPPAFYYDHERDRPGKHVYHAAGLYYIQDASAMAPAEALSAKPGEKILDLCAAPGGKTTQLASQMQGKGVLVANEIDGKRIKALVENLERCGVTNAIVLNETPAHLAARFPQYFDGILIDAPCSGEGMFRKDPETATRWSLKAVEKCAELQYEILTAAAPMLRPGGRLVYSTCTFNPTENEQVIAAFLKNHPGFEIKSIQAAPHYQPAHPEWAGNRVPALNQACRLWPHHLKGEGHFVVLMEKKEEQETRKTRPGKFPPVPQPAAKVWKSFIQETYNQTDLLEGTFTMYGDHLYQVHPDLPSLKGLRVERPGRYLGQAKRSHFVPSHALALSSLPEQVKQTCDFQTDDPDLLLYLQGETLPSDLAKGWTLVTVDGYPIGWGKVSGNLLKNHYPKWLRWDRTLK